MQLTAKSSTTQLRTRRMTYTAMLGALAAVLMFFELPLPFMPPFLKMDFSGIPVLMGGFALGPASAIAAAFIKNFIHLLSTQTGGVGELADFIILSVFTVVSSSIYRRVPGRRGVRLSLGLGILAITITGMFANRYLLIPFYSKVMPIDAIISTCQAVNPMVDSLNAYILFGAGPFNLLKGLMLSVGTLFLYRRLSPLLTRGLDN